MKRSASPSSPYASLAVYFRQLESILSVTCVALNHHAPRQCGVKQRSNRDLTRRPNGHRRACWHSCNRGDKMRHLLMTRYSCRHRPLTVNHNHQTLILYHYNFIIYKLLFIKPTRCFYTARITVQEINSHTLYYDYVLLKVSSQSR